MEKRKPHCPLPIVHALVKAWKVRTTKFANATARPAWLRFHRNDRRGAGINNG